MQFTLGNHTSIGRVRTANEDAFGNWPTPNGHLFVVCDGMGGHIGGAIASQAAVSAIYQTMASQKFPSGPIALEYCLQEANKKLHGMVVANPSLHGMGTTAVAVLIQEDAAWYAHIGDSRLYLFRQNALRRLTRDHSFVQSLVDQGHISEEEAEKHPRRNEIYRALGIGEAMEPSVAASPVMLQPGDRLLLCTDGLNGMIGDKGISGVMSTRGLTVQQQAERLVQLADDAGGHDNTTVQIIMMRPTPQPSIGEPASIGVAAAAAAAAASPVTATTTSTTTKTADPTPPPAIAEERPPEAHFLEPVEEKKPRKPLLPIIGGITLFVALVLLAYNFLREPDAPKLGMENGVDTAQTVSAAPGAALDSMGASAPDTTPATLTPTPAPKPVTTPAAATDSIHTKKATAKPDTVRKVAPTLTMPAATPKKDTVKKAAPKAPAAAAPKQQPAPQPSPKRAAPDTSGGRAPKAVMPTNEPAP